MPTVIDLFAGVGGLSLGAARAGFEVKAAIEIDPIALQTHALNFPKAAHISDDVSTLSGIDLLTQAGVEAGKLDGLIGGPPCQGFSNIGRRRLDDSRNNLFYHFFRLVSEIRPTFFVAENVPGIMQRQYDNIRQAAFQCVADQYIVVDPVKAIASEYGAPTTRTRYFFIGINKSALSRKSNHIQLDFSPDQNINEVNVRRALEGLPIRIRSDWVDDSQGWRRVKITPSMQNDPFFERVTGRIPPNVGHSESIRQYQNSQLVSGCLGTRHAQEIALRYRQLKHGKIDPISRSPKLDPDGLCPTLRAGTGKERGSYQAVRPIHHSCGRVITPREAARLQGFPDWFRFHETKWHSFRQIGNSVCPIVAESILAEIYRAIFLQPESAMCPTNAAELCVV